MENIETGLPAKLEEIDALRWLALTERITRIEAQKEMLQQQLINAQKESNALQAILSPKYKLDEKCQINLDTGVITRPGVMGIVPSAPPIPPAAEQNGAQPTASA